MRLAWLSSLAFVAACQEPTPPPPVVTPSAQEGPETAADRAPAADPPSDPTVRVSLEGTTVLRDGAKAATLRPAAAPGVVTDAYQAAYAHPGLEVPSETPVDVTVGDTATVGDLRQLVASLRAPGHTLSLRAGAAEPTPLLRPAADSATAVLRPRDGGWTLYRDDAVLSHGQLSTLAKTLAEQPEASLEIDVLDTEPATVVLTAALAVASAGKQAALSFAFAPCVTAPERMVCIPGGPAVVGYDDGQPEEAPERELLLSTYYVDQYEVTNAEYDACHDAGACKVRINSTQNIMKPFVADDQPAMPMDWHRARSYCAWSGKRLPTEWEWEKAARGPDGELFPWGDEEPTCERSVFRECAPFGCKPYPGKTRRWDCNEHATKPVGSFAAGHYGIFDMAGNGYEWTQSAGIESTASCGDACNGLDPMGPCDGAFPCKGQRILRGGSWYWPKHRTRGSHRRLEKLKTGSHRLGMRCATENPFLTAYPPMHLTQNREAPAVPEAPSTALLALFDSVPDDPIEDKRICGAKVRESWGAAQARGGRSETTCRDPFPYLMTNEPRSFLWNDYVANLGGAYAGIGSDQNYSTIAAARSEWAWVVDYDPRVVRNHRRVLALIIASETADDFVAMFSPAGQRKALEVLDAAFEGSPERKRMRAGFLATRSDLFDYYTAKRKPSSKTGTYGWLRHDANYDYIRLLATQGRLRAVAGDLLRGDGALAKIGAAATAMHVPLRVYYTSNAPSSWGGAVTPEYRANVTSLPFDALSLVLQTNSRGGFKQTGHWHHSVSWARAHVRRLRLPGYDSIPKLLEGKTPGHHGDVTLLGIPTGL